MGFRVRKSFKIAPGIKMNIGKKSSGLSIGGKGARVTVNTSGRVTTTMGIPGSGISYTDSHATGKSSSKEPQCSSSFVEHEPISLRFDMQTLRSLSSTAFDDYAAGYMAYAETVGPDATPEDVQAVSEQLRLIREETMRRRDPKEMAKDTDKRIKQHLNKAKWRNFVLAVIFLPMMVWGYADGVTVVSILISIPFCIFTALFIIGFLVDPDDDDA